MKVYCFQKSEIINGVLKINNYTDQLSEILAKLGLTKKESEVFLYLAKSQVPKDAKEIINRLRFHKGDTYRILKSLQSKGIVESTIDRPMAYNAVPIEKVIDLHIKATKEQINCLEANKNEIIAQFKSKSSEIPMAINEKFLILKRQEIISAKGLQVLLDAKKEVLWLVTNFKGLTSNQIVKCNVKIRSLFDFKSDEVEKVKLFMTSAIKSGINVEPRSLDLKENMTYRLLIGDNKSAMLVWESKTGEDMVAFWTDSEVFVRVLRVFFEGLWSNAVALEKRIQQVEQQVNKESE